MKTLVVYESQTGFTQQYALWIARRLHCPLVDRAFLTPQEMSTCDLLIYGGHVSSRGVSGFRTLWRRFGAQLPDALVVFGTGMLGQEQIDCDRIRARTFRGFPMQPQFFYFRGTIEPADVPLRFKWRVHINRRKQPKETPLTDINAVRPLLEAVQLMQDTMGEPDLDDLS
ncbi:flavodoxin domain-containing protein [Lacticaseibacillus yichunensis]|uniref:Flavodoxin domain-containing protein n=1 Tax=Lacticaseibacillus yichunensis TaxID=2486015 RepID=A0ABW4CRS0_9LACO|nr:hypothetical protein [Lacticaseibacillus yichunensis]